MDEYKQSYLILWTACTEAMEEMERQNFGHAREILLAAQQNAEAAFIEAGEPPEP